MLFRPLLVLCGVALSTLAYAEPHLALTIADCDKSIEQEVVKLIGVELHTTPLLVAEWNAGDAPVDGLTTISCRPGSTVLTVENFWLDKKLGRDLNLHAVPTAVRARTVAMATIELLADGFVEFRRPTAAAPEPAPPPLTAPQPPHEFQVSLQGGVTGIFDNFGLMGGGGIRIAHFFSRHLAWSVDIEAWHGSHHVSIGSGEATAISSSALLMFHLSARQLTWWIGPGLRAGAVRLAGTSSDPLVAGLSFWSPLVAPVVATGLIWRLPHHLLVYFAMETGYDATATRGVLFDGSRLAIEGFWLGGRVGFGLRLPAKVSASR